MQNNTPKKPLLIATLGYPGSGKTYFSERLAKEFNFFHMNADKIRSEMFEKPIYTPLEHQAVFRFIDWLTEELLSKGMSVIIDANSNKRVHREKHRKIAARAHTDYILVYMRTPLETAEKRLSERQNAGSGQDKKYYQAMDVSVLHRMKKNIEYPEAEEVAIEIDGLEAYPAQLEAFKKALEVMGLSL